jgi:uncharacterized membrane protein
VAALRRRAPLSSRKRTRPSASSVLAGLLIGAGATHFAVPAPFDTIVPPWIPGTPRFWTYASGVAEVAVGTAVAVPRTRRVGGLAAAALFMAVFPANVQMAWDWRTKPWPYRVIAFGRLPLQVPMIDHALKVSREAD